jgi:hypothetical protein
MHLNTELIPYRFTMIPRVNADISRLSLLPYNATSACVRAIKDGQLGFWSLAIGFP